MVRKTSSPKKSLKKSPSKWYSYKSSGSKSPKKGSPKKSIEFKSPRKGNKMLTSGPMYNLDWHDNQKIYNIDQSLQELFELHKYIKKDSNISTTRKNEMLKKIDRQVTGYKMEKETIKSPTSRKWYY
jgi:hypothetical protein